GAAVLVLLTNAVVVYVGAIGFLSYVVAYAIGKRRSVHGTLVGSISGSVPLVVGYVAASGRFDLGAALLFVILACWQMPHFYAIAIYRAKDYKAAGLPVLPVKRSVQEAKIQIVCYIVAYALAASALTISGYTGYSYLVVILGFTLAWLRLALMGFKAKDSER